MSTYVFMKILESAPSRYDVGIRLLTFGRLEQAYDRLAAHIKPGQQVLDLGCGTGALTLRAARKGAFVTAIDVNPGMLDVARKRVAETSLGERVQFAEKGVAELETEPSEYYDVVTAGLLFSELSGDEINFTLQQITRLLKPGGILLIADEVRPSGLWKRLLHQLVRIPLMVTTYLLTQTTTHPIKNLAHRIEESGLKIKEIRSNWLGTFMQIVARKPGS